MDRRLTPKQEAFCQALLAAESASDAYRRVYNSKRKRDIASNASRLLAQPHIDDRVKELRDRAATDEVMELREAMLILSAIARGRLSDYLNHDGGVDVAKVVGGGPEIEDIQLDGTENGQRVRLKLRDPVKAIERLGRLCGWDKSERSAPRVSFEFHLAGS